jgi:hypothetical protein
MLSGPAGRGSEARLVAPADSLGLLHLVMRLEAEPLYLVLSRS